MQNKANQTLDVRLVQNIAQHSKELDSLKRLQPVGADNLPVISTIGAATVVLQPNGTTGWLRSLMINWHGQADRQFLATFRASFYIDHENDPTYLWPGGSNISADQFLFDGDGREDMLASSEEYDGTKCTILTLKNFGTSIKTVYCHFELMYALGAVN